MRVLSFLLLSIILTSSAYAKDMYLMYEPQFTGAIPKNIYIAGAECKNKGCTEITSNRVEIFNGDEFNSCREAYKENANGYLFGDCIEKAKISGSIINTAYMSTIVIKESTDTSIGYIKQFFTSGDLYIPLYARSSEYTCDYDICIDNNVHKLDFGKKTDAIAKIGRLTIKDTKTFTQIGTSVAITSDICSAFTFVNPDVYRFNAPEGFSDYATDLVVKLIVTDKKDANEYFSKSQILSITASHCVKPVLFSWEPDPELLDKEVMFKVKTYITDNQVSTSISDSVEISRLIREL